MVNKPTVAIVSISALVIVACIAGESFHVNYFLRQPDLPTAGLVISLSPRVKYTTRCDRPNKNVHTFYYVWYDNPKHNGRYMHWNHEYISHKSEPKTDTKSQGKSLGTFS